MINHYQLSKLFHVVDSRSRTELLVQIEAVVGVPMLCITLLAFLQFSGDRCMHIS